MHRSMRNCGNYEEFKAEFNIWSNPVVDVDARVESVRSLHNDYLTFVSDEFVWDRTTNALTRYLSTQPREVMINTSQVDSLLAILVAKVQKEWSAKIMEWHSIAIQPTCRAPSILLKDDKFLDGGEGHHCSTEAVITSPVAVPLSSSVVNHPSSTADKGKGVAEADESKSSILLAVHNEDELLILQEGFDVSYAQNQQLLRKYIAVKNKTRACCFWLEFCAHSFALTLPLEPPWWKDANRFLTENYDKHIQFADLPQNLVSLQSSSSAGNMWPQPRAVDYNQPHPLQCLRDVEERDNTFNCTFNTYALPEYLPHGRDADIAACQARLHAITMSCTQSIRTSNLEIRA